jgi:hypothetical protein
MSRRELQVFSLPAINSTSSAEFSFSGGQPTVIFQIPAQQRMIDPKDLKLVGKITVKDTTGAAITVTDAASRDLLDVSQGATLSAPVNTNIEPITGVQSCISKITVQSKKTRTEIQQITQAPDYLACKLAYTHNKADFMEMPNSKTLASGSNSEFVSRRMTLSSDGGKPFSTHLSASPLLAGASPIHLGPDHFGGLIITLHLAPDSEVLSSYYRDVGTGKDIAGSSYVLSELRLQGRYIVPTMEEARDYPKEMILPSRLSLLNDVLSSVDQSVFTPQIQMAQGFVSVFQSEDQQNNFKRTQTDFKLPPGVESTIQQKDGIRYPFKMELESIPNFRSTVENGAGAFSTADLLSKCHGAGLAELQLTLERALFQGSQPRHVMVDLPQLSKSMDAEYATRGAVIAADGVGKNLDVAPFGLGSDQTFGIQGNSQSYINQDYSLRIVSGVATGNALLPEDFNTVSFVQRQFVPLFASLDTTTLVRMM